MRVARVVLVGYVLDVCWMCVGCVSDGLDALCVCVVSELYGECRECCFFDIHICCWLVACETCFNFKIC